MRKERKSIKARVLTFFTPLIKCLKKQFKYNNNKECAKLLKRVLEVVNSFGVV